MLDILCCFKKVRVLEKSGGALAQVSTPIYALLIHDRYRMI